MFLFTNYAENLHDFRFCLIVFALAFSANTLATEIHVFTNQQHPIEAPTGVRVIQLNDVNQIEAELAANLPSDPGKAATLVKQHLEDEEADLQRRLTDAYRGIIAAWNLGIIKIPAIVVDGQFVVYGERNVSRALASIESYRRAQP